MKETEIMLGNLEITNESGIKVFGLSMDIKNKLMYFIEKNGTNEPTICLSIDSLSPEPIKNVAFKQIQGVV